MSKRLCHKLYAETLPGLPPACRCCGGPSDDHFEGCGVDALEQKAQRYEKALHLLRSALLRGHPRASQCEAPCFWCEAIEHATLTLEASR